MNKVSRYSKSILIILTPILLAFFSFIVYPFLLKNNLYSSSTGIYDTEFRHIIYQKNLSNMEESLLPRMNFMSYEIEKELTNNLKNDIEISGYLTKELNEYYLYASMYDVKEKNTNKKILLGDNLDYIDGLTNDYMRSGIIICSLEGELKRNSMTNEFYISNITKFTVAGKHKHITQLF